MAVVRPSRSAPPIALITFVFLFLVAAGLAIFFGLQMAQARAENAELTDQYKKYIKLPAEQSIAGESLVGNSKDSAFRILYNQAGLFRELIGGRDARIASADNLNKSAIAAAKLGNADNLIAACNALKNQLTRAESERDSAIAQAKTFKDQLAKLQGPFETNMQSSAAEITKLEQQVKDKTDENSKLSEKALHDADEAQKAFDVKQRANDQAIRDEINRRQQLEDQNEALRTELKRYREPPIRFNENPILWQPDGRIIRTPVGKDEVWVNIGRKDRVTPNITFSVYDPKLGVGSGPDARGKGAIEIVEVGETESRARITHVEPGESLTSGDLIANVVFNKIGGISEGPLKAAHAKVYKFYVFGDFDLDGDGISTPSERDQVIRMIQNWGGEVVDKLDTQTDFLILGAEPGGASGQLTAVTDATADMEAKIKADKVAYVKLLVSAKENAIPILDANRFFAYIGYYNNTIVGKKN